MRPGTIFWVEPRVFSRLMVKFLLNRQPGFRERKEREKNKLPKQSLNATIMSATEERVAEKVGSAR